MWMMMVFGESNLPGVLQIRLYRSDHDPGLNGQNLNAHQGNPCPGVDHNALVENPIENLDQAGRTYALLDGHTGFTPFPQATDHFRADLGRTLM